MLNDENIRRLESSLDEKAKVVLEAAFSWGAARKLLVHVLALSATTIVLWMNLSGLYAWDRGENMQLDYFKPVTNSLQFAAKLHEIFIQASTAAILTHHIRKRLLGKRGVPLGLVTADYQSSSAEYFISRGLWSSLRVDWRLTLFTVALILYANTVGSSSAILMMPTKYW